MLGSVLLILLAVAILWKCAGWFVEGAVGVAETLNVPHMLVGLVLVSIGTTSPELVTSLLATLQGKPDVALGNAIGSVAIDASLALGLAAVISAVPLKADRHIFRSSAIVLVVVLLLSFLMVRDGELARWEGSLLFLIYVGYTVFSYFEARRRRRKGEAALPETEEDLGEIEAHLRGMSMKKIVTLFAVGLVGVLIGSELLFTGAMHVAERLQLSGVVVGVIVVALGTSTPEIATCVAAALKRQSAIGVGNIIGADILNICWVAGLSSMAHPLSATVQEVHVLFPGVIVIVLCMLIMLRHKLRLTRWNGAVLLVLYAAYMAVVFFTVGPAAAH